MSTKKTTTEKKTNSDFFTFSKIGDKVSGILKGFSSGQYGLIIALDNHLISANKTQLFKIVKDNRKIFKVGKKLSISFVDEKKVKGQRHKVKIFSVMFDGKELKSNSDFELKTNLSAKEFDVLFT